MLALTYLDHMLGTCRPLCSRRTPGVLCCVVSLGFVGTPPMEGLTSLGRCWRMEEADDHRLWPLFHSSAWCLDALVRHGGHLVVSQQVAVTIQGRAVLRGDHPAVVKDARRMPGVVPWPQDSATQSTPHSYRGHSWGVVGVRVGSRSAAWCLPLDARLPPGFAHLDPDASRPTDRDTPGVMLVQMARECARRQDLPSILVLDAFCAIRAVVELATSLWSMALTQPDLTLLTRAQKSAVAYREPPVPTTPARGRPRQDGDNVTLSHVFETPQTPFLCAPCQVYGRVDSISSLALHLVWKPIHGPLRFLLALTSRGPMVLMWRALTIAPLRALSLSGARVRIATMCAMLTGVLGTFAYRFGSQDVPRHARTPQKHATLQPPKAQHLPAGDQTWQACERLVRLGCGA